MDSTPPNPAEQGAARRHTSYDEVMDTGVDAGQGIPIQCQFCPGQAFRRSRLRMDDIQHLFLMRYPVRCLRCGQRQLVSFTVAGISVPSHIKQRRARHVLAQYKSWKEPEKFLAALKRSPEVDGKTVEPGRSERDG